MKSTVVLLPAFAMVLCMAGRGDAQVLRLGPFDFESQLRLEGIYTTNVEQERPEESNNIGEEQPEFEDYYLVLGLDLNSQANVMPRTVLTIDSGLYVEKHFVRDDLDSSSNPFGRLKLDSSTAVGRYTELSAYVSYESLAESQDDRTYVPGGRKKRDEQQIITYGGDLSFEHSRLRAAGRYNFKSEEHDEVLFQDGDEDVTTIGASAGWKLFERAELQYDYTRERTDYTGPDTMPGPEDEPVPVPPDPADGIWEETHVIGLQLTILRRPLVQYTPAYEKEDEAPEKGEWEWKHTWRVSDDVVDSRRFTLSYFVDYSYEEEPEEDDVAFTYSVMARHQISPSAYHNFSVSREPYDTFGSTEDTDNTTVSYSLTKEDLFIYNLDFSARVSFERDEPMGRQAETTEIEETWIYSGSLLYQRMVTRKLERALEYAYSYEDSNLEEEILEEHRVTLSFIYVF